jgi:hypothetical protein
MPEEIAEKQNGVNKTEHGGVALESSDFSSSGAPGPIRLRADFCRERATAPSHGGAVGDGMAISDG